LFPTKFLKFLKFIKSLDYKAEIFDGDSFWVIISRVKYFLNVSHYYYNCYNKLLVFNKNSL